MRAFRRIAIFDVDPELVSMPLSRAVLCMNCERISNSRHQRCDVCGSSAILALAAVLGSQDPTPPETPAMAAYATPIAA
jgi:hypothetical protein